MKKFGFILIILFVTTDYLQAQFTNVMIDNFADPEEPSIAINPLNPNQIAAGSNLDNYYYSNDGGATWINNSLNTTFSTAGDPCIISDSSGSFFYFHLVNNVDRVVCQKSTDGGATYNNGSFTWNNNILFQDKEWAVADPVTGNLYVTWTQYDNGTNPGPNDSSNIYFSRSTDNGTSFSNGMKINKNAGDCLYLDLTDPHPFVGINGEVYVTFMDSAGIRFNKSLDTGLTWLPIQPLIDSGSASRYNLVPGVNRIRAMPYSSCDRSNGPYRGNLYVSWSDQRNGINNSDIFFIKSTDGGNTWTNYMKVNSDSSGRQQYRNAMAVDQSNGNIYIVYYDRRNYPTNDTSDVYISKSVDGGDHWTDYKISNSGFYSDGTIFDGDYIDIAACNGIVRPIWTRISNFTSGIWTCLFNESSSGISSPALANHDFNFTVNPNPANVVAVISFSNRTENTDGNILDASGRIVLTFKLNHETEKILDVHDLTSGIYFIKIGNISRKLIVE